MVIDANMPRTSEMNGVASCRPSSTMLVYCLHGLCAFPNIVINANIAENSWKRRKKRNRYDLDYHWYVKVLLMESGNQNHTRIQWQEGAKKCQIWKVFYFHLKNSDKIRKKYGWWCWCWGTVYMVCVYFLIW